MSRTSAVIALDSVAPTYDTVLAGAVVDHAQRERVWEMTDRVFLPGQRILEINCGTGIDAEHLAHRGVRVRACDASRVMIDAARDRMQRSGAEVDFEVRAIEELGSLKCRYDGLLSNFGGLNCVQDLNLLACDLNRLIRVGGNLIICYMGPFCAWETAWYLLRGQPGKATRRWKRSKVPQSGNRAGFTINYPAVRDLRLAFAPEFELREWTAVGLCVPPSHVDASDAAHPRAMRLAMRLDRYVGSWPLLRAISDHVLVRFEKVYD